MRYSTYGIHAFKTTAIVCQIVIHAQAWMMQTVGAPVTLDSSLFVEKARLMIGAFSMMVPMTAAAVIRLSTPLDGSNRRLTIESWRPYVAIFIFLSLIESFKHALVYGWSDFFGWDALHMIVVSFALMLGIGQYSLRALWPVAAVLVLGTPLMIEWLGPYDPGPISIEPGASLSGSFMNWGFLILIWLIIGLLCWMVRSNSRIEAKYRRRSLGLLVILGVALSVASFLINTNPIGVLVLRCLWVGALVGTKNAMHIWGIFPWAGVTLLGFLIYDLILRTKGNGYFLAALFTAGLIATAAFYLEFSDVVVAHCSPRGRFSGLSGECFNRTPEQVLLIVGLFCMAAPLACGAERAGLETRFVQAFSRSILWIYLFQTSVMVLVAGFFALHVPIGYLLLSFQAFSFTAASVIALVVDRFPWQIHLSLRKAEA